MSDPRVEGAESGVAWRRPLFADAASHHGYHLKLQLADPVPEGTLRGTPTAVAEA